MVRYEPTETQTQKQRATLKVPVSGRWGPRPLPHKVIIHSFKQLPWAGQWETGGDR